MHDVIEVKVSVDRMRNELGHLVRGKVQEAFQLLKWDRAIRDAIVDAVINRAKQEAQEEEIDRLRELLKAQESR